MTMIERAARAICSLEGSGGFCACVGGDLGCKNGRGEQRYADGCVASRNQLLLSGNMDRARAVLQAIREPSEGMIDAIVGAPLQFADDTPKAAEQTIEAVRCGVVWTRMIDAALSE